MNSVLGCLSGVLKPIALLFLKCKMGFTSEMLAKQDATKYAGGPQIYENKGKEKQKSMEVLP